MPVWVVFYVSVATFAAEMAAPILEEIEESAHAHNAALGLTGALIFGGRHFAEIIEGPREAVYARIQSITDSPYHRDLQLLVDAERSRRRFTEWSLVFARPSQFITRGMNAAFLPASGAIAAAKLERFMFGMASA